MDISKITPDAKDLMRARDIFDGTVSETYGKASKMAKLIRNKEKLVRRAKAVAHTCGDSLIRVADGFGPFKARLRMLGFSDDEIHEIKQFRYNTVENVMSDWF